MEQEKRSVMRFDPKSHEKKKKLIILMLDVTPNSLGEEHPDTSVSAWNYLTTLLKTGDTETASEVLRQYLLWLLEHDPITLGGDLQQIRAGVAQLLESAEGS